MRSSCLCSRVWVSCSRRSASMGSLASLWSSRRARLALGATPQSILKMILSNIARWTIAGAALGLLGAWLCARLLESLLFQVHAHDPLLLGLALLILLGVGFFAAWIPARRAMRVDPIIALRYE